MNCPYRFDYQGKQLCVLGMDCASKTKEERATCMKTASFFHKDITPDEIDNMKKKLVQDIKKRTISIQDYQVRVHLPSVKSADQQKKEFFDQ